MLSDASAAYPAMPTSTWLCVDDADAAMPQAPAAGATRIMAVANMPYNDRQGCVKVPCGSLRWLLQRLVDGPYRSTAQGAHPLETWPDRGQPLRRWFGGLGLQAASAE